MKKIASFLSTMAILHLLVLVGFVGFLAATGRINKAKALAISDMLKQQGTPENFREKVYEIMAPATQTQPATSTAPATQHALAKVDGATPASAQDRLDYLQKLLEQERLRLDNQKQSLDQRQQSLNQQQTLLDAARAELDTQKKDFDARVAAASNKKDQSGFEKTLALFAELKTKQVKDMLATMTTEDIARYITTMDADRAAKVIAEFKTDDEKNIINGVLDKIRGTTRPAGTGAASATPPAALSTAAVPPGGP